MRFTSELYQNAPVYLVISRSFGGFASKDTFIQEAAKLAQSLPASASYHTDFYLTAGYDAPFKVFNRHNEVWFIAE